MYECSWELAEQYAETLRLGGCSAAAVAVLAEAARAASDPDTRYTLRMQAARAAEGCGRADLAAEVLVEAFQTDPHIDLYYEPLMVALEACQAVAEKVAMAEEIERFCGAEQRALWRDRASKARAALCIDEGAPPQHHPLALARRRLHAFRARALDGRREALAWQAQLASSPRERGRALAMLAHLLVCDGDPRAAVAAAAASLAADPTAADAALLILQFPQYLPAQHSQSVKAHVARVFGEDPLPLPTLERIGLVATGPAASESPGAVAESEVEALARAAHAAAQRPARLKEALPMMVRVVRSEPWRTRSLWELRRLALAAGDLSLAVTTSEIISLFIVGTVIPPVDYVKRARFAPADAQRLIGTTTQETQQRLLACSRDIVALLPEVQRCLRHRSLDPADGIRPGQLHPVADALAYAARQLSTSRIEAFFFDDVSEGIALHVSHTGAPVLLVDRALKGEADVLRFLCGRALEASRPEQWMWALAGASEQALRVLLTSGACSAHCAELPAAMEVLTARAGLVVCGNVRAAAEGLLHGDPRLRGAMIREEAGFIAACQASPAFVEVLRFALSDAFLAARTPSVLAASHPAP